MESWSWEEFNNSTDLTIASSILLYGNFMIFLLYDLHMI